MPRGELRDIAIEVLRVYLVIVAFIGALEHCPKRLDPNGMRVAAQVRA